MKNEEWKRILEEIPESGTINRDLSIHLRENEEITKTYNIENNRLKEEFRKSTTSVRKKRIRIENRRIRKKDKKILPLQGTYKDRGKELYNNEQELKDTDEINENEKVRLDLSENEKEIEELKIVQKEISSLNYRYVKE